MMSEEEQQLQQRQITNVAVETVNRIRHDGERLAAFLKRLEEELNSSGMDTDTLKQRIRLMKPALESIDVEFVVRPRHDGTRTVYLRKRPVVRKNPTRAMIDTRIKFADAAREAIGSSFVNGRPPVVDAVLDGFADYHSPYTKLKMPKWQRRIVQD